MSDTLHIYTRVSTRLQEEEGTSLDSQKELGIQKSKELGMNHKVWNEGGKSSSNEDLDNRPVLKELLLGVEAGRVKHLFVYNNDRLSRNDITQQTIKISLLRNDVVLYTKDGQFDLSNPTDKLIKSVLDSISSYDNQLRAERSRLGKVQKVKQGFWFGGPPPFGYQIVEKKLTLHPEESKWVKKMYGWYYDRKTIIWIKSQLDKSGVLSRRGKLFSTGSIIKILQNTHPIGHYTWTDKQSGETITCSCPPIVDETVWNECQEIRKRTSLRKNQNNRTRRFYLLRDLLVCGECGSNMSGRIHDLRNQQIYFCPKKNRDWKKGEIPEEQKWERGKVGQHGCSMNRSLNIPVTDKYVWDVVVDTVSKSSTLKERFKTEVLRSKFEGDKEYEQELQSLKTKFGRLTREVKKIQKTIGDVETDNLLGRYEPEVYGTIKSNLDAELKSKRSELEQTRLKRKEVGNQKKWLDWLGRYQDVKVKQVQSLSNEEKKEWLGGLLERIEVRLDKETKDHHLEIFFKMGLVNDGVEYKNSNRKKDGYVLVEGERQTEVVIPYDEIQRLHKETRRTGRRDQISKKN